MKFEDYQKSLRQKSSHTDKTTPIQPKQDEARQDKKAHQHTSIFASPIPYQILASCITAGGRANS